ncbi:phosphate signaling complex protein PhoU [Geobacillus thermodenitrificans]|jgi:phosphate transport system protein|uniref:Phosphate-specific transport system accessory protein PhoU n=2 Tax=Geobacillus thermodenitrificans TaxID=33940 RepID=A4IQY4_GEOTN|nr:phosphate signaling complex protein PhoU [Geobacillus thermodenitrificans]ABO67738.1 Phosphate transport system protein PhoU [Geobacillus thermodenitrificans NG80-2]ARA99077.1 phosphate transport system regulatory protein PhoU [Geobacillus thermodenitrificans]ARP43484.1 Phosphate transport system protein PhoU [Geobacillus thermodenitrificans]ATO38441.1 phosphate transport system regulatory protein PhoU [Geobacillus thermodenitrificans]MED3716097.1 phosphate signaling complex protein PhoU [G
MRETFADDLRALHNKLIEMGRLTEVALQQAIESFQTQNKKLAMAVIDGDGSIDKLEEEVNDFALWLIAKQQPVATDLRRIVAAIKIASDIERIADFAVNIAKACIRIGGQPFVIDIRPFVLMHRLATDMVSTVIAAYDQEDVSLAAQIADMDHQVDEQYGELMKSLLEMEKTDKEALAQMNVLALVARYMERTADHATNIAEHLIYLVKGKHYDLND